MLTNRINRVSNRIKWIYHHISSHTVSKLKTGFVGLPNTGKSTLFNAVTQSTVAKAANYPFCTILPNIAIAEIPDPRLDKIFSLFGASHKTPSVLEFVDIAGLVRGSSKGMGLGNQFLSNIRQVNVVIHVVRHFVDSNIIHVDGDIDPLRDHEIIHTELCLADINSLDKKKMKKTESDIVDMLMNHLSDGKPAKSLMNTLSLEQVQFVQSLHLLTAKPVLYALNVSESDYLNYYVNSDSKIHEEINEIKAKISKLMDDDNPLVIPVSAQFEFEITRLSTQEKDELVDSSLMATSHLPHGIHQLLTSVYRDLIKATTFYTADVNCEAKAWSLLTSTTRADDAASTIHSDFKDKFIKAQIIGMEDIDGEVQRRFDNHKKPMSWDYLIKTEGECNGKRVIRSEGREYLMRDGDMVLFKIQK